MVPMIDMHPVRWSVTLQIAARVLRAGGVVMHATEGVWGLACNAFDDDAVHRILLIKNRPASKGLIVIGDSDAMFASELANLTLDEKREVLATWPGAVTWIVPNIRFSPLVTGNSTSVAVRVPGHDQSRRLVAAAGMPLVSTSANRTGESATDNALIALRKMGGYVDFVLPGRTGGRAGPSQIRRLDGQVIRT